MKKTKPQREISHCGLLLCVSLFDESQIFSIFTGATCSEHSGLFHRLPEIRDDVFGRYSRNRRLVSLDELAAQKLVLMERDAPYSIRFEQELRQQHLEYNPVFRLQSAQTALRVVMRDAFVTVLPLYSLKEAAEQGQVRVLNVPQ